MPRRIMLDELNLDVNFRNCHGLPLATAIAIPRPGYFLSAAVWTRHEPVTAAVFSTMVIESLDNRKQNGSTATRASGLVHIRERSNCVLPDERKLEIFGCDQFFRNHAAACATYEVSRYILARCRVFPILQHTLQSVSGNGMSQEDFLLTFDLFPQSADVRLMGVIGVLDELEHFVPRRFHCHGFCCQLKYLTRLVDDSLTTQVSEGILSHTV